MLFTHHLLQTCMDFLLLKVWRSASLPFTVRAFMCPGCCAIAPNLKVCEACRKLRPSFPPLPRWQAIDTSKQLISIEKLPNQKRCSCGLEVGRPDKHGLVHYLDCSRILNGKAVPGTLHMRPVVTTDISYGRTTRRTSQHTAPTG